MSARELITEHLDLWTGAVTKKSSSGRGSNGKVELAGVKKLRELILELAVRGQLIEQSSDDSPVSILIEEIHSYREKLVDTGELKKQTKLPDIPTADAPYHLPEGWEWCRMGELAEVIRGVTYKKHQVSEQPRDEHVALLRANNIQETITDESVVYVPLELINKRQLITKGDILIAMSSGSANLVGKAAQASSEVHATFGAFCAVIRPLGKKLSLYLGFFTTTPTYRQQAQASGKGIGINNLNKKALDNLLVPVPPIEEQHRIVQKVDELMALCDRMEQQTSDQLEAHETLVDTLLGTLTQSENAAELAENWARLAAHFDTLFTTEQSIDKLKQTILQLAVMGRLVEKDAEDEPAVDLLTQIHTRKVSLAGDRRIKQPRPLAQLDDAQYSYTAPAHWAWASFQDVADEISTGPFGSMIHKHDYVEGGIPLINPSHMANGKINEDSSVSVSPPKAEELSGYKLVKGDIVMARRGEVGRCAVVTDRESGWLCGTGSFVLRFHPAINRQFILLLFSTNTVREYLSGNSVGTTMTNLNHGILKKMPVALPPAKEQHRIVQKVDELMTLCDQLKERLNQASETRNQLAEAVVDNALN
ncbi:MAG: restriction endonuclease subunit S [Marinobacter sp.]|nr:restriction endonuclease subunit S [Marinobacter sp.]